MASIIKTQFGHHLRVRVCGLCWQGDNLLLVRHWMGENDFWAPPGGGVEFGQQMDEALSREYREETGLEVEVGRFRFFVEFIRPPLHAIEVFFDVQVISGTLQKGTDPEMPAGTQIIRQVEYLSWAQIAAIPPQEKHGILSLCRDLDQLKSLTGFHRI
jgi:8-oxo-dGTP diphosphatase